MESVRKSRAKFPWRGLQKTGPWTNTSVRLGQSTPEQNDGPDRAIKGGQFMRTLISTFVCIALVTTMFAQQAPSGSSDTCGPISGKAREDLENLRVFCERGIPEEGVVGAYARGPLLLVRVNRDTADIWIGCKSFYH